MAGKIEFKETYPTLKDSIGPESDSGPQSSLNPIFSVIFCDNHKVSVYIEKLMMRGFTAYTCISLKIEGPRALQNKA